MAPLKGDRYADWLASPEYAGLSPAAREAIDELSRVALAHNDPGLVLRHVGEAIGAIHGAGCHTCAGTTPGPWIKGEGYGAPPTHG